MKDTGEAGGRSDFDVLDHILNVGFPTVDNIHNISLQTQSLEIMLFNATFATKPVVSFARARN
jgi:hypothetical protein